MLKSDIEQQLLSQTRDPRIAELLREKIRRSDTVGGLWKEISSISRDLMAARDNLQEMLNDIPIKDPVTSE